MSFAMVIKQCQDTSCDEFEAVLAQYQQDYENGIPAISDAEYDHLTAVYRQRFGQDYSVVGANPTGENVVLPTYMGSLNKIKGVVAHHDLDKWVRKFPPDPAAAYNYVVMDKIDGVSALYTNGHLFTRGNGHVGTDISFLLQYVSFPSIPPHVIVRGELMFPLSKFGAYVEEQRANGSKSKLTDPRSTVTGILNSRDNLEVASNLRFVAYQIIGSKRPWTDLKALKKYGFTIPWAVKAVDLDIPLLEDLLNERRSGDRDYAIDGIVIATKRHHEFVVDRNPTHMFSFKIDQTAETVITKIEWNPSRHGSLIPVIHVKPVRLLEKDLTRLTGNNAQFIKDHQLGVGARITVAFGNDTIPTLIDVITPGVVELPMGVMNGVHLMIEEDTPEVHMKRLVHFAKTLEVDGLGPGRIEALYKIGITTIVKLLTAPIEQLTQADKIGMKVATTIRHNLDTAWASASLVQIMNASGSFEAGFGSRKLRAIIEGLTQIDPNYGTIDGYRDTKNIGMAVARLGGFNKLAVTFEERLPAFIEFYNTTMRACPVEQKEDENLPLPPTSSELKGVKVLFTGFTDKPKTVTRKVEAMGGSVVTSFSKSVGLLIAKDLTSTQSKITSARAAGTRIISLDEFMAL